MYDDLRRPYQVNDVSVLQLGSILMDGQVLSEAPVNLVLKSLNRHGLIAGATGSGKTKTVQVLAEQLSLAGVPSLVMDIKGDVSGLSMPGENNERLFSRNQSLNLAFNPRSFPVELLTLTESTPGVPLRSTVDDFGPLLFSRMLGLNEAQSGVMTIVFEYAEQENLPLIDLNDVKSLLQFLQTDEGKYAIESSFGLVSSASIGAIMRKLVELASQGGAEFFGEPAFDVRHLIQLNEQGEGIISILRLLDMQDKPLLFSTFMLKLLSDIYRQMPELGDPDKPKLVLFIDEAHLIFKQASKALLSLLETMVKLIRSKGVGLIFCTQTPNDIPESVLSQLGLKIQHALRAFTAKDRKAMKLVAQNFPPSNYYQTEHLLTSLGIGEALVCALDAKGQPTPLVHCLIRAPESRMGILTDAELTSEMRRSRLYPQYQQRQDRQSAYELLEKRKSQEKPVEPSASKPVRDKQDPSMIETVTKNTLFRQVIRQLFRDLTRELLVLLGLRKKK